MIVFPHAKINLGLQILSKRLDGYHNIDSCFFPIPLKDALEIILVEGDGSIEFSSSGLNIPGNEYDNLCVKAYHLLNNDYTLPSVQMHLLKKIPMGAGLGGGSADAAFTLKLLNDLCDLKLKQDHLEDYALQLGSDCPFFLNNGPQHVNGRGEKMKPINVDLKGLKVLLVFPELHIGTAEAYSRINPRPDGPNCDSIIRKDIKSWEGILENDFEISAFTIHPQLKSIKEELYKTGAAYASMTGSGSTMYGVFEHLPEDQSGFAPFSTWSCSL